MMQAVLAQLERQTKLLEAAAQVGHAITSLLDLDELFEKVVDIICDTYGFYYSGVFLIDAHEPGYAVLQAGRGEIGRQLVQQRHRLQVADTSMIGWCIGHQQARIAPDVDLDAVHHGVASLPETRSEMALPLIVGGDSIGALTIQSAQENAFNEMDVTSLQAMANQLAVAIKNAQTHAQAQRRARLLETAAQVGSQATSILNLDELLPQVVDLICEAYGFYYAGVFLVDENNGQAVLHAGRGAAGRQMIAQGHRLKLADTSMIGWCIIHRQARIALDVGQDAVRFANPFLPDTRSEMALPLAVGDEVIGALTIQSAEKAAFSQDDITSLQALADLIVVAIENARLLAELDEANRELVRTKTFEAIAASTGEAIHWIGNKAAPILTTLKGLRGDLAQFALAAGDVAAQAPAETQAQTAAQLTRDLAEAFASPEASAAFDDLRAMPPARARRLLNAGSIVEDLDLIEEGARLILAVTEGLIGPTREHKPRPAMLQDVLKDTVVRLGIAPSLIAWQVDDSTPLARVDTTQISRAFANLINNALEAMRDCDEPRLTLGVRPAGEPGLVQVTVTDNGCGIAPEELSKIWVTFYTTKNSKEHPGLGLPACLHVIQQMEGRIAVESQAGAGTTFTLLLPAALPREFAGALPRGNQSILLVDDDDAWRHFAQAALESVGYRVHTAASANDLDAPAFDHILVDQLLEQDAAVQVVRALRGVKVITSNLLVEQATEVEFGVLARQVQDAILDGGLFDFVLGRPASSGLQVDVALGKQARLPVVDVGFLVVQRGNENLRLRHAHVDHALVDPQVVRPHLGKIDAGDHLAVRHEDQLIAE